MTRIEITFIYQTFAGGLTQKKMKELAEEYISQMVLSGEDITQHLTVKIAD